MFNNPGARAAVTINPGARAADCCSCSKNVLPAAAPGLIENYTTTQVSTKSCRFVQPHSIGYQPRAPHVSYCCQMNWWVVVRRVQMKAMIASQKQLKFNESDYPAWVRTENVPPAPNPGSGFYSKLGLRVCSGKNLWLRPESTPAPWSPPVGCKQ